LFSISGLDFLKYLTERFTTYISPSSTDEKENHHQAKKQIVYTNHWFGILPLAVRSFFRNNKSR